MNIQCFNQMGEFYIEAYEANSSWDKANSVLDRPKLLCFSKKRELWSSKATFTLIFFAAVNHNYEYKLLTLKNTNKLKSTNHNHKQWPFEPHEVILWAGLFKAGLRYWIQIWKLKSKFRLILFVYNLMSQCSKKNRENQARRWS